MAENVTEYEELKSRRFWFILFAVFALIIGVYCLYDGWLNPGYEHAAINKVATVVFLVGMVYCAAVAWGAHKRLQALPPEPLPGSGAAASGEEAGQPEQPELPSEQMGEPEGIDTPDAAGNVVEAPTTQEEEADEEKKKEQ
jgi:hypothetical protein